MPPSPKRSVVKMGYHVHSNKINVLCFQKPLISFWCGMNKLPLSNRTQMGGLKGIDVIHPYGFQRGYKRKRIRIYIYITIIDFQFVCDRIVGYFLVVFTNRKYRVLFLLRIKHPDPPQLLRTLNVNVCTGVPASKTMPTNDRSVIK